ncbi:uncharacterized protein LOC111629615 [Centruroides sculpturatus]|uniref:uncharacterized protein LOC111629615 n=1 Tax=Centruroides sculpturatus TaxID=218467 RepID=UPI000C6D3377|nr:uncharacterized protein LOC111629615 [Centruroides sculpturatus]
MTELTVLVPLHPPHGCQLCLPIPRDYADHAGLVKHLKHVHGTTVRFECRACGYCHDKLKVIKAHQLKADDCRTRIEACSPPSPLPADRKKVCIPTRPRKPYVRRKPRTPASPTDSSDSSWQSTTPSPSTRPTTSRIRRTTRSLRTIPEGEQLTQNTATPSESAVPSPCNQTTGTTTQCITTEEPLPLATTTEKSPRRRRRSKRLNPTTPSPGDLNHPSPANSDHPATPRPRSEPTTPPGRTSPDSISFEGLPPTAEDHAAATVPPCVPSPRVPPLVPQQPPPPSQPPSDLDNGPPQWVLAWAERFNSAVDEDMFEHILMEFIRLTYDICDIQGPRRGRNNAHSHNPPSQLEASIIQRLYRTNRKRAFDRIVGGDSRFCQIDAISIHNHFRNINEAQPHVCSTPVPAAPDPAPATRDPINVGFTPEEVANRIAKGHNTAPGPDKIRYLHWRRVDPSGIILSAIFNAVQRIGHVPHDWRESTTVLIHKKGDLTDLRNWRPICLSNTLGKLYTACLADRLLKWCEANNRLSTAQKGFLHYQGCVEHNFVLKSIIQDARRTRRECFIAWLDIANAFGSIPHGVIWESLKWHGLHPDAITTIQQLYTGSTTRIRTCTGYTEPVAMLSGVHQGCPISPLLFILTVEPALRRLRSLGKGYNFHNITVDALAYADDVALVSSSSSGLQEQLDSIEEWAKWAGIKFNNSKCGTLSVLGKSHTSGNNTFSLYQKDLPKLGNDDAYRHLGVPTRFSKCDTEAATTDSVINDITKIDSSHLAPWQKVDALNTFIMPRLTFCLTTGTAPKKTLDRIDRTITRHVKRWLSVPQRASNEIVFLSYKQGGANVTPSSHLADIAQISHAVHLFSSRDEDIIKVALGVRKKCLRCGDPDHEIKDCPVKKCYRCKSIQHLVKDCPACYNCGKVHNKEQQCPKQTFADICKKGPRKQSLDRRRERSLDRWKKEKQTKNKVVEIEELETEEIDIDQSNTNTKQENNITENIKNSQIESVKSSQIESLENSQIESLENSQITSVEHDQREKGRKPTKEIIKQPVIEISRCEEITPERKEKRKEEISIEIENRVKDNYVRYRMNKLGISRQAERSDFEKKGKQRNARN